MKQSVVIFEKSASFMGIFLMNSKNQGECNEINYAKRSTTTFSNSQDQTANYNAGTAPVL